MLCVTELFARRAKVTVAIADANGRVADDEMDALVDHLGELEGAIVLTRSTSDEELRIKCGVLGEMAFEGNGRTEVMLRSINADRGW